MTEIKDITVRGRGLTTLHFPGCALAEVSTERASSSRWVVMTVYTWPANGSLVLSRTGESVTYHSSPSPCLSGERSPMPAGELADDAEPCPQCRPGKLAELGPDVPVIMEKPWHSFSVCTSLTELEDALLELQPAMPGPRRPSRVTAELLAKVRQGLGLPPAEPERPPLVRVTMGIPQDTMMELTRAAAISKTGVEQEIVERLRRSVVA
jgi:hypothetical protein